MRAIDSIGVSESEQEEERDQEREDAKRLGDSEAGALLLKVRHLFVPKKEIFMSEKMATVA